MDILLCSFSVAEDWLRGILGSPDLGFIASRRDINSVGIGTKMARQDTGLREKLCGYEDVLRSLPADQLRRRKHSPFVLITCSYWYFILDLIVVIVLTVITIVTVNTN